MVANIIITGKGPLQRLGWDQWPQSESMLIDRRGSIFKHPHCQREMVKTKYIYQTITFIYKNKYLNRVTIIIEKFVYAVFNLFLLVIGDFAVLFIRSIIILIIQQFVVLRLAVCTKILKVLFRPSYSARFTPITYRMNTSSTFKDCTHVLNLILTKKAYGCHIHI